MTAFLWNMRLVRCRDMGKRYRGMGKSTEVWGRVQRYGEEYRGMGKSTEVWGRVQRYGEEYRGMGKKVQRYGANGLRTKVKFFCLTFFTFSFTLPVSILLL